MGSTNRDWERERQAVLGCSKGTQSGGWLGWTEKKVARKREGRIGSFKALRENGLRWSKSERQRPAASASIGS